MFPEPLQCGEERRREDLLEDQDDAVSMEKRDPHLPSSAASPSSWYRVSISLGRAVGSSPARMRKDWVRIHAGRR